MRQILLLVLIIATFESVNAQFVGFPTGANRPDVSWSQLETEHFTIIYHNGLEQYAHEAADVAETIYPVVTGNLQTPLTKRTPLYLSDLDDIPNAFAFDDDYMYIWMRGILDDMGLGGIRSAGRAKWFRAVITHEFTHIVIAAATSTWIDKFVPAPSVPRWFNEGTARFMEPDGWTTDIDMVLRVAAVNARLGYDLNNPGALDGTLLYETGHSMVRYMTWRFGDTILAKILHAGRGVFGYDFNQAVYDATGKSFSEIYADWRRTVTVLYGAEYYGREEVVDISEPITTAFDLVTGVRYSPDGNWIAMLARTRGESMKLYLTRSYGPDSLGPTAVLNDAPGFDGEFSWSPDGSQLVVSKGRYGHHNALVHDLYIIDRTTGELDRLTTDAALTDPVWSPDGRYIVAVQKRFGRDNLVLVDPVNGAQRRLTTLDGDIQMYTPSWSPDGAQIAFSLFDESGLRSIAVINSSGGDIRRLTSDTANNRYPVWSPDGKRIAFTSHASGVPNLAVMNADGTHRHYLTDVAGGLYSVQWMPGSDFIVAISFNSRDQIVPHLISASRSVTPTPPPAGNDKYSAWQRVHLALQVPSPERIGHARILDSSGYSSLASISPLLPFLPIAGSDISRNGSVRDERWGALTVWNDPMNIHTIVAYADYGLVSKEFGGEFYYVNNYLPVTLALHGDYSLGFRGIVADSSYFQRNRGVELSAEHTFLHPDRFDISHTLALSVGFRELEPWNILMLPEGVRPVRTSLGMIEAGYDYANPHYWFNARGEKGIPMGDGSTAYTKIDVQGSARLGSRGFGLIGTLRTGAVWGMPPPQEFLGLDNYDQFQGGFQLGNFGSFDKIAGSYRVRGIRRYQYGDRVAVGTLGLEMQLGVAEGLFPILSAFNPSTLLFVDVGSAWYSDSTALSDIPLTAGYGVELRSAVGPYLYLSAGIAFEMIQRPRRDFYIRFTTGF